MKLGVSTWCLLNSDLYSAVKTIGDTGVGYIELWGEIPHAYPAWVDRGRLRDALSIYDMTLTTHAPFTNLNPGWPFEPVRGAVERVLEEYIDFSADLGASIVTVHPGNAHNELLVPQMTRSTVVTLQKLCRAAQGRLTVNVENMTKSGSKYYWPVASDEESLQGLLSELPSAGCTFDTGHSHASGQDLLKLAEGLGGRVTEVHLSDNKGTSDDHLVPGEGTAPLDRFLDRVRGSDVLMCMELDPHRYSADEIIRAVAKMNGRGHLNEPGAAPPTRSEHHV